MSDIGYNSPQITKIDNKLYLIKWNYKETIVSMKIDDTSKGIEIIKKMYNARISLDLYGKIHPQFFSSFFPLDPKPLAPEVAFLMAEAAYKTNVGPMAAVAGALVDTAVNDVDTDYLILENGGEIYVNVDRQANVGIHAGPSPFSGNIILKIKRNDCPLGLGTSSASVGYAISFGEADAATVVSDTVALADAASTAICNTVDESSIELSLKKGADTAKKIEEVKGVIIIRGSRMIVWGKIPKLTIKRFKENS